MNSTNWNQVTTQMVDSLAYTSTAAFIAVHLPIALRSNQQGTVYRSGQKTACSSNK